MAIAKIGLLMLVDIFRFPVQLHMRNHASTFTKSGKIFTMLILSYICYALIESNSFTKKNPKVSNQDLKTQGRPHLNIGKGDLGLIFGLTDEGNNFHADFSIFSFKLKQMYANFSSGEHAETEIKLKLCQPEDLLVDSEFFQLGLENSFCLANKNETLRLGGFWDEKEIYFLELTIERCENSTMSDIICKSSEYIDKYFENSFYFSFYINENIIDENNFEKPVSANLTTKYTSLDRFLLKEASLYLKKGDITTNDGLVFDNFKYYSTFLIGQLDIDISSQTQTKSNTFYMLDFMIYSSSYTTVVTRDYQNLAELFANISGILNFLIFVGFIICSVENRYNVIKHLINKLFIIEETDHTNKKKILWKKRNSANFYDDFSKNITKRSTQTNKNTNSKLFCCKLIKILKEKIFRLFKRLNESLLMLAKKSNNINNTTASAKIKTLRDMKEKKEFRFSFFEYLKFKLKCGFFQRNKKERLFSKASQQVKKEMDIVNILKKLEDIEKLKKIILNDEELFCFNLLSKPIIDLEEHLVQRSKRKRAVSFSRITTKKEVENMYEKLSKNPSVIGKRILKMIDNRILGSLEIK